MRRTARFNVSKGRHHLKSWWVQKYNRPTTDGLYTSQSEAELLLEMYEDLYARRDEIEMKLEGGDVDHQEALKRINAINKVLGEHQDNDDPLVDEWEADIEAGRIPDLDK